MTHDSQTTRSRWHDPIRVEGTPERRRYLAACHHQLVLWLGGQSVHNHISGECCPDFSCCHPDMLMPQEARNAYALKHLEPTHAHG